jgi:hypothetical protein
MVSKVVCSLLEIRKKQDKLIVKTGKWLRELYK